MGYVIVFWVVVFFVLGCDVHEDHENKIKYYAWQYGPIRFYFSKDTTE